MGVPLPYPARPLRDRIRSVATAYLAPSVFCRAPEQRVENSGKTQPTEQVGQHVEAVRFASELIGTTSDRDRPALHRGASPARQGSRLRAPADHRARRQRRPRPPYDASRCTGGSAPRPTAAREAVAPARSGRRLRNGLPASALARKYPHAARSWLWNYVFPSERRSRDARPAPNAPRSTRTCSASRA